MVEIDGGSNESHEADETYDGEECCQCHNHGAKIQQNPQSSKTLVVKDAIQREHQKL